MFGSFRSLGDHSNATVISHFNCCCPSEKAHFLFVQKHYLLHWTDNRATVNSPTAAIVACRQSLWIETLKNWQTFSSCARMRRSWHSPFLQVLPSANLQRCTRERNGFASFKFFVRFPNWINHWRNREMTQRAQRFPASAQPRPQPASATARVVGCRERGTSGTHGMTGRVWGSIQSELLA